MPTDMRLTVTLPAAAGHAVLAFLLRGGLRDVRLGDPGAAQARVIAYVPEDDTFTWMDALGGLFAELRGGGLLDGATTMDLDDDDRRWAGGRELIRVPPRFVLLPPEADLVAAALAPGEIALPLETGDAFGDGRHPSTALCLGQLAAIEAAGGPVAEVLDVGCGTGVLSVAAARLWPGARVVGVDIAPEAVALSESNVARLGLGDRIAVVAGGVEAAEGRFALVVANLTPRPLQQLSGGLAARVAPGGGLVIAGFRAEGIGPLSDHYAGHGLRVAATAQDRGWGAIRFEAPAG